MANKTGKQSALEEYKRELKRIDSFIRKAEKRGYRFDEELFEEINAIHRDKTDRQITRKDVKRLSKYTPDVMYERSQAISTDTGKIITGTERRKQERIEASRKGAKTRAEQKERLEKDKQYRETFTSSRIMKNRLEDVLNKYSITHPKATGIIRNYMNTTIAEIGEETFVESLDNFDYDIIAQMEAHFVQYNDWYWENSMLIEQFINELRGGIPMSQAEAEELYEAVNDNGFVSASDYDGEIPFE